MKPYTVTIRGMDGHIIATGQAEPDEGWQAAAVRIYQATRPAGEPSRTIALFSAWEGEKWDGVATVSLQGLGDDETPIEQIIVETDPPQFSQ